MNCCECGKPERIVDCGGVKYTNTSPYIGACADCLNKAMQEFNEEERKSAEHIQPAGSS